MSSRKDQRVYDPEFKKEAVRLVIEKNRGCVDVASSLVIPKGTLYTWIHEFRQHQEAAFPGHLRPEDEDMRRLHRRIADLEEENEILKKRPPSLRNAPGEIPNDPLLPWDISPGKDVCHVGSQPQWLPNMTRPVYFSLPKTV